jgi:hypothetical protein
MGLLYRVGSFRPLSYRDLGNLALKGAIMKLNTLRNSITTLEKLRDAHHSQLDTRVLLELDEVIAELKRLSDSGQYDIKLGILSKKSLLLISQIINVITNITNLMK